jgi:hypothetical protein
MKHHDLGRAQLVVWKVVSIECSSYIRSVGPDISIQSISFPALDISHQRSTSIILSRSLVDTLYTSLAGFFTLQSVVLRPRLKFAPTRSYKKRIDA